MTNSRIGRSALVYVPVLVVALIGAANLIASAATPFATGGDTAVTELMVRGAASFDLTYGPYSRYGWRHPGPAFYYTLAPFQTAFGVRGMFLGIWAVNLAATVCTVWVVRRRAGDLAAIWASGVMCVLLLVHLQTSQLWWAWNPAVLTMPLVLTAVLAAASWAGSRLAFAGTLVVGSFLVQVHVGTAPIVVLAVALASAGLVRDVVRRHRNAEDPAAGGDHESGSREHTGTGAGWRRTVLWVAAGLAVTMIWLAPIADSIGSNGGNILELAKFFTSSGDSSGAGSSMTQTLTAVTRRIAVFPLGADPWTQPTVDVAPISVTRLIVTSTLLLLAAGVLVRGRRVPFAAALGGWTILAFPVVFLSVSSISDGVYAYLIWWLAAVPVPAVIGAGVLASDLLRSRFGDAADALRLRAVAAAVCALPALLLGISVLRAPNDPEQQWTAGPAAAERLLADPLTSTEKGVRVAPAQETWPVNSALAAALARRGVEVSVTEDWLFMFGDLLRPTGDESVAAVLLRAGDDPKELLGPDARDLGPVGPDGERLWVASLEDSRER